MKRLLLFETVNPFNEICLISTKVAVRDSGPSDFLGSPRGAGSASVHSAPLRSGVTALLPISPSALVMRRVCTRGGCRRGDRVVVHRGGRSGPDRRSAQAMGGAGGREGVSRVRLRLLQAVCVRPVKSARYGPSAVRREMAGGINTTIQLVDGTRAAGRVPQPSTTAPSYPWPHGPSPPGAGQSRTIYSPQKTAAFPRAVPAGLPDQPGPRLVRVPQPMMATGASQALRSTVMV